MRVTIACLAVSVALSVQSPHLATMKRTEEALLARTLDDGVTRRRSSDKEIHWDGHFLKGNRGQTYVPFTVRLEDAGDAYQTVAVGIRVLGWRASWNDAYVVVTERDGNDRVFRGAFSARPGDHRVLIAIIDRNAEHKTHASLFEQWITVPDFGGRSLRVSSVVVAERVDSLPTGLSNRDRSAYPYALGSANLVPMSGEELTSHDKLTVAFQIYNVATFEDGKPDVEVRYRVFLDDHSKNKDTSKNGAARPLGSTEPQLFNQETLPEDFTLKDGFQLTPIQTLPLGQFEPGSYRLEIEVEDMLGNAKTRADVPFTIRP